MTRPERTPRLADVAAHAGVSLATASRALAASPGVSASVAAHVRNVAAELGYVANVHARTLAGGSNSSLGLVVHEIGDPYFTEIASGALSVAAERGLTVQICHTGRDLDTELAQIRALIANRVHGVVVAGSGYVERTAGSQMRQALLGFRKAGGRVAVIGRHHIGADAVLPDNIGAGRSVAGHLLAEGHRRIAVASGWRGLTTVADRLTGIEQAMQEFGLTLAQLPVVEAAFNREGGTHATHQILAQHRDVTAIIALNDDMAIGVLSSLRANGIGVPTQMSVTGFDDVVIAQDVSPPLTTTRLPLPQMGADAVRLLFKPRSERPRRVRADHQLVTRESTGPAPAESSNLTMGVPTGAHREPDRSVE